jgi:hypothetical protein
MEALFGDFSVDVEYHFERYTRSDFALDNVPGPGDPANPVSPDDLFLGINDPGYEAHIVSFALTFYF